MNDLLANPAVQSGLIPLLVALPTAWLLSRLGWLWAGLGFALGYYCSVYLTAGFDLTPLTSTRKILLLGAGATVLGVLIDLYPGKRRVIPGLLLLLGAGATLWLIWPLTGRSTGAALWWLLVPSMFYTGWLVVTFYGLRRETSAVAVAALTLGLGTGVSALLGASALLGQLGSAIASAAGAFVLLLMFMGGLRLGSSFALPAGLLGGLIGISAVAYASLPWHSLLPLALIPVTASIPLAPGIGNFKRILWQCVLTLPLAGIAIFLTWRVAGSPLY